MKQQGSFTVQSVKEVSGFLPYSDRYPNQYNSGRVVSHSNEAKALLVSGSIDGVETSFFSPSVLVRKTSGYLNYTSMKENSWFELIEGETKGYKGHEMFDGGPTPNIALATPSTLTVKIKEGDELNIAYKPKGEFRGTKTIKNVRIL